ncbi:DUF3108 domain-containing protein [Biformimicrobium ophioploci]|uniref:DUF3108 domain-containing protein n=1 Tax=Biformimicrobium ophioploci TaxID=3036711 RepID=A0ABQ6M2I9_9GAMM|nr:DUF3108 domain-containing protein [Microbulbifer sp. NKW57]GMG88555.1 DUF3108 domain-containing protein [Microbulbifer sp. NKW57]
MPLKNLIASVALLLLLQPLSASAEEPFRLEPFTATYTAKYGRFDVTATRELARKQDGWALDFTAKSFFAKIAESSELAGSDEGLVPTRYEYHRTGLGKDRHLVLEIDHHARTLRNIGDPSRSRDNIPVGTQDKLSIQLQLARDLAAGKTAMSYNVADRRGVKQYRFEKLGEEVVKTPLGKIKAVKVARIREGDSKRRTTIWFAPEWGYALVKLHQREENGKLYSITLSSLTHNGRKVPEE